MSLPTKRSRERTVYEVLKIIADGHQRPTNIMYNANVSWSILQRILGLLTKNSMITEHQYGKRKAYKIASEGKAFVESYEEFYEGKYKKLFAEETLNEVFS